MSSLSALLPHTILSFLLMALLVEVTPGPNMTYLALVAMRHGRRAGFATVAGVASGLAVIGLAASYGVAQIIQASPVLFETLRWCGVVYMAYLAYEGWTGGPAESGDAGPDHHGRFFVRGFITNALNPKAALFYISILPTFVEPGPLATGQALVLTGAYVLVATGVHMAIVALAGSFTAFLTRPDRERATRRVLSLLLAGVALWFAWSAFE